MWRFAMVWFGPVPRRSFHEELRGSHLIPFTNIYTMTHEDDTYDGPHACAIDDIMHTTLPYDHILYR